MTLYLAYLKLLSPLLVAWGTMALVGGVVCGLGWVKGRVA